MLARDGSALSTEVGGGIQAAASDESKGQPTDIKDPIAIKEIQTLLASSPVEIPAIASLLQILKTSYKAIRSQDEPVDLTQGMATLTEVEFERIRKEVTCPLTQFTIFEPGILSTCRHVFEFDSIATLLRTQPKCPTCRKPAKEQDVVLDQGLMRLLDVLNAYHPEHRVFEDIPAGATVKGLVSDTQLFFARILRAIKLDPRLLNKLDNGVSLFHMLVGGPKGIQFLSQNEEIVRLVLPETINHIASYEGAAGTSPIFILCTSQVGTQFLIKFPFLFEALSAYVINRRSPNGSCIATYLITVPEMHVFLKSEVLRAKISPHGFSAQFVSGPNIGASGTHQLHPIIVALFNQYPDLLDKFTPENLVKSNSAGMFPMILLATNACKQLLRDFSSLRKKITAAALLGVIYKGKLVNGCALPTLTNDWSDASIIKLIINDNDELAKDLNNILSSKEIADFIQHGIILNGEEKANVPMLANGLPGTLPATLRRILMAMKYGDYYVVFPVLKKLLTKYPKAINYVFDDGLSALMVLAWEGAGIEYLKDNKELIAAILPSTINTICHERSMEGASPFSALLDGGPKLFEENPSLLDKVSEDCFNHIIPVTKDPQFSSKGMSAVVKIFYNQHNTILLGNVNLRRKIRLPALMSEISEGNRVGMSPIKLIVIVQEYIALFLIYPELQDIFTNESLLTPFKYGIFAGEFILFRICITDHGQNFLLNPGARSFRKKITADGLLKRAVEGQNGGKCPLDLLLTSANGCEVLLLLIKESPDFQRELLQRLSPESIIRLEGIGIPIQSYRPMSEEKISQPSTLEVAQFDVVKLLTDPSAQEYIDRDPSLLDKFNRHNLLQPITSGHNQGLLPIILIVNSPLYRKLLFKNKVLRQKVDVVTILAKNYQGRINNTCALGLLLASEEGLMLLRLLVIENPILKSDLYNTLSLQEINILAGKEVSLHPDGVAEEKGAMLQEVILRNILLAMLENNYYSAFNALATLLKRNPQLINVVFEDGLSAFLVLTLNIDGINFLIQNKNVTQVLNARVINSGTHLFSLHGIPPLLYLLSYFQGVVFLRENKHLWESFTVESINFIVGESTNNKVLAKGYMPLFSFIFNKNCHEFLHDPNVRKKLLGSSFGVVTQEGVNAGLVPIMAVYRQKELMDILLQYPDLEDKIPPEFFLIPYDFKNIIGCFALFFVCSFKEGRNYILQSSSFRKKITAEGLLQKVIKGENINKNALGILIDSVEGEQIIACLFKENPKLARELYRELMGKLSSRDSLINAQFMVVSRLVDRLPVWEHFGIIDDLALVPVRAQPLLQVSPSALAPVVALPSTSSAETSSSRMRDEKDDREHKTVSLSGINDHKSISLNEFIEMNLVNLEMNFNDKDYPVIITLNSLPHHANLNLIPPGILVEENDKKIVIKVSAKGCQESLLETLFGGVRVPNDAGKILKYICHRAQNPSEYYFGSFFACCGAVSRTERLSTAFIKFKSIIGASNEKNALLDPVWAFRPYEHWEDVENTLKIKIK